MASSGLPTILFLIVSLRAAWAGGGACWEPPWRRCLRQDSRKRPSPPTMGLLEPHGHSGAERARRGGASSSCTLAGVIGSSPGGVALPVLLRRRRAVPLRLLGL